LLAAVTVLAAGASNARADTALLDFESAPPALDSPITTEYQASAFTYFQQSDGFRPYRESVAAGRAQSGTVIGDIGPSHCAQETGGGGAGCEFAVGGTTAHFTHTAQSVTVYTGFYTGPVVPDVQLRLTAYRANNSVAGTTTSSDIGSTDIKTPVMVSSAAADIEHVRMDIVSQSTSNNVGAELGIDDVTLSYPAGSLPELAVSVSQGPFAVLQGKSIDVPVALNRLNGSNGNVALFASGLPSGVTASFTPDPVPGTQTAATMHLTASADAPVFDNPQSVTITADPGGNASVAPDPRTASTLLRVGTNFGLQKTSATPNPALVPACGSVDVPFTLARDRSFNDTVTLSLSGVPANVGAQILPGATIAPGGNFNVDGAIRLTGTASFIAPTFITLTASSPGAPAKSLSFFIGRGPPKATVDQQTGTPPSFLQPGSYVHVTADGICPGTQYGFGQNTFAANVDASGQGFSFRVPHGALTGPVKIIPPSGTAGVGQTSNSITIVTFSSVKGFQFNNYPFGSLSFSELAEEYGDGLFIHVNPCIFVDCTINTYIPDPTVLLVWPILNEALKSSGGHCFGISRAIQELLVGWTPLSRFTPGATSIHDLGSTSGPGSNLGDWLDAKHSAQGSAQFLYAWATRDRDLHKQWLRAQDELAQNRPPIITMQNGSFLTGQGHAVIAYDEQEVPDGHDILVYDNNAHDQPDGTQRIHISSDWGSWSFKNPDGSIWSGGPATLFAVRRSDIPATPELPGIGSLLEGLTTIFGSSDGSAQTTGVSPGEQGLPVVDSHAPAGSAVMFVGRRGLSRVEHTVKGTKHGSYDEAIVGRGFATSVTGVSTGKGITDTIGGSARTQSVTFDSGMSRPLSLQLATRGRSVSFGATVTTHVDRGRTDSASLTKSGALAYSHSGSPSSLSFTLTQVRRGGGVVSFVSPRLRVAGGELLLVRLGSGGVADVLSVRGGHRHRFTLRSRGPAAARLRAGSLAVHGRVARLRLRADRLRGAAALGASLRIMRGHTVVVQRGLAIRHLRAGARTLRFRLPRISPGRYVALVRIEVLAGMQPVRTAELIRRFTIRVT
jgi:hypothetical protein